MTEQGQDHVYDACIVGMGIGGLATALALEQSGLSIYVTERDYVLSDRKQGYGLTLTNSTTGPLAKLGLLDACIASNCPSHSHFTFKSSGDVLGYYGRSITAKICEKQGIAETAADEATANESTDPKEFGGSRGNLRVPRQELRQMMLSKLSTDSLHWRHRFLRFEERDSAYVTAFFEVTDNSGNISHVEVKSRILVGADGIRSTVRQHRDEKLRQTGSSPLRYVGASVILGISEIDHPLLCNRGYYVIDGTQRLFTMPFLTPSGDSAVEEVVATAVSKKRQIMWQLSFSDTTESDGRVLRGSSHDHIFNTAISRTKSWFPAVGDLIKATLPGEIWATPLYDRDAMVVLRGNDQSQMGAGRVTVLGDACHPMSMFKGQGANQALEDAVLLASKLSQRLQDLKRLAQKRKRTAVDDVNNEEIPQFSLADVTPESMSNLLRTFEREMIGRADKKVKASRAAAALYHSPDVFNEPVGIHGVNEATLPDVLQLLKDKRIDANLGEALEDTMSEEVSTFVVSTSV